MVIIAALAGYFIIGNAIKHLWIPPTKEIGPHMYTFCRPTQENTTLVPFPFQLSDYTQKAKEGDVDTCSGQVYSKDKWVNP